MNNKVIIKPSKKTLKDCKDISSILKLSGEIDEYDSVLEFDFDIILQEDNKKSKIGSVTGYILNFKYFIKINSLFYIFDCLDEISEEMASFYTVLLTDEKIQKSLIKPAYYISEMKIKEKYRNLGIGTLVLADLNKSLTSCLQIKVEKLVLAAGSIEFDEQSEDEIEHTNNRLISYYNRNGFKLFSSSTGYNFMIK